MIWLVPRGVSGEKAMVVLRFGDGDHLRAILSRSEVDYRGRVFLEHGTLLLYAEGTSGDVFDLRTGRRVDPAGIPALQEAIRHLHGCESRWVESVPVHEKHDGDTVWRGEVQVFDLVGHPTAKRAYAWSHATEGTKRKFVAVLGVPPVVDAKAAVQASVVATFKKAQN
jgi:hypothetical protein